MTTVNISVIMMKTISVVCLIIVCFACLVHAQSNQDAIDVSSTNKKVGVPEFRLKAAGSGTDSKNWNAGVGAAVGTKIWESKNGRASFGLGAAYNQGFARSEGYSFKSKPDLGIGANFRFRFKRSENK
ncbi:diptericin B [Tachypleus tridentatus]|uniref:diptericin B n=1 Tax=Tachypleus tridentatus TaxID=6853 RepID=UPI003FD13937